MPEDAVWFAGNQSSFSDPKDTADSSYSAAQVNGYSNYSALHAPVDYGLPTPGFLNIHPPFSGMSSSEWLRQFRETHNIAHPTGHLRPLHTYPLVNPRNLNGQSPLGQWGVPLPPTTAPYLQSPHSPPLVPGFLPSYRGDDHRKDNLFHDSQLQNTDSYTLRNDPQPLLQYLKEKEWRLQWDPTMRGPTYMGS